MTAPTIDLVRALRTREHRERTGLYAFEGVRFLVSAADTGARIEGLVVCEALLGSVIGQMIVRRLRRGGVPVAKVSETELSKVARLTDGTGRGVIAIARQRWSRVERLAPGDVWLAIEAARSPGNLGTLLRTCLAVGARGVIALGAGVDPFDPACVRATMGALHGLQLARVSPAHLAALAKRSGARIVGASPDGTCDFRRASYAAPTPTPGAVVVVVGGERAGMSVPVRRACDLLVRIPMAGAVDSLNMAVAGSLVLYEASAQLHAALPNATAIVTSAASSCGSPPRGNAHKKARGGVDPGDARSSRV